MATLTIEGVKALDFGYLTGIDLLVYTPYQLIIKQMAVIDTAPDIAASLAYAEILSALSTTYNIDEELIKRGTARNGLLVKLLAIAAARNICSNLNGIPENIMANFTWLDKTLLALRNGQIALTNLQKPSADVVSSSVLIHSSFETIG